MLTFGTEIRMYSWAMMFVSGTAVSAWYIVRTERRSKVWWTQFVVCFTCCAYTHHYATFAASICFAILLVILIIQKSAQIRQMLVALTIMVALYVPMLKILLGQIHGVSDGSFWIEELNGFRTVVDCIFTVFHSGSNIVAMIYFAAFCVFALFFLFRRNKQVQDGFAIACLGWFAFFLAANFLISVFFRPLFVSRYMVPLLPVLFFFFAIESGIRLNRYRATILACFLSILAVLSVSTDLHGEHEDSKDFDRLKTLISENINADDVFLYSDTTFVMTHVSGVLSWLYPDHIHVFPSLSVEDISFNGRQLPLKLDDYSTFRLMPHTEISVWIVSTGEDLEQLKADTAMNGDVEFCGEFKRPVLSCQLHRLKFRREDVMPK